MTHMDSNFSVTVNNPGDIPEVLAMREAIRKTEPDATGCRITLKAHTNGFGAFLIVSEEQKDGAWTGTFLGNDDRIEAIRKVMSGKGARMDILSDSERLALSSKATPRAWWEKKRRQREVIAGAKARGISVADYLAMQSAGLL